MANVKLPSGKIVKIPDGKTEKQAIEFLFENLPDTPEYAKDKELLGDQLDTSGWGSTIGGGIGSVLGAGAGIFTSPSIAFNPVTLGAAGGATGSALGEWFEQMITGKGDLEDIGKSAAEGGIWGVIPGAGGQAAKTALKAGLSKTASTVAGVGTNVGAGATAGAAGANITGLADPTTGALVGGASGLIPGAKGPLAKKVLGWFGAKTGLDKQAKKGFDIAKDAGKGFLDAAVLKHTGRQTAGNLTNAATIWQLRRDLANFITKKTIELFKKNTGKAPSAKEARNIKINARKEADRQMDKRLKQEAQEKYAPPPKPKIRIHTDPKSGRRFYEDELGNKIDADTGQHFGKAYAMGGEIPGYQEGGIIADLQEGSNVKDFLNTYILGPRTQIESNLTDYDVASTVADFTPIVGDIKAGTEAVDAARTGDYLTAGLLGGATAVGLIPGVGDVAAQGIKSFARSFKKNPATNQLIRNYNVGDGSKMLDETIPMVRNEKLYNYIDTPQEGYNALVAVPKGFKGTPENWMSLTPAERVKIRWETEGKPVIKVDKPLTTNEATMMGRIVSDQFIDDASTIPGFGKDIEGPGLGAFGASPTDGVTELVIEPGATKHTLVHESGHGLDVAATRAKTGQSTTTSAAANIPADVMREMRKAVGKSAEISSPTSARIRLNRIKERTGGVPFKELVQRSKNSQQRAYAKELVETERLLNKGDFEELGKRRLREAYPPAQWVPEGVADAFTVMFADPKNFAKDFPKSRIWLKEHLSNEETLKQFIDFGTAQGMSIKSISAFLGTVGLSAAAVRGAIEGNQNTTNGSVV